MNVVIIIDLSSNIVDFKHRSNIGKLLEHYILCTAIAVIHHDDIAANYGRQPSVLAIIIPC